MRDILVLRQRKAVLFLVTALCLAGVYAAWHMPASVFPRTDFPRVVILIDNGVMPADVMMATVTRPVEEAMKDIPGTRDIRSATGRGSAEVNVFFDGSTHMVQAELYVLGRLAQIRGVLPAGATFAVHRLTFSAFPIIGISLTSSTRSLSDLWDLARYEIRPRFLRIPGVARVKIVGGRPPEFHVVADPARLAAYHLSLEQVNRALEESNLFVPAGMSEERHQLYLNVVDNRIHDPREIEKVVIAWQGGAPVRIRDVAQVRRGTEPRFNIVTADQKPAVLLNVYSQPKGNTVAIADALKEELTRIRTELPPDLRLAFFYDQSLFVREGVRSVWESILLGLLLSCGVLLLFLKSPGTTLMAAAVIPVTVLFTLLGMAISGMSFNLMTLGGIAASIGLIIDDAIVVAEAVHAKARAGHPPRRAVVLGLQEVLRPLVGSTLTPVVVFLPLAFLTGVPGVFFRALALTMVTGLLSSLLLAVTWTPALGSWLVRTEPNPVEETAQGGPLLRKLIRLYEWMLRAVLARPVPALLVTVLVTAGGVLLYGRLETGFLPDQDEGAFVLDYFTRPGTSLTETDRMLRHVERILAETPEVESFSRRTGARLALAIAEPNTGDFLVKLRPARTRTTSAVIDELRRKIQIAEPALHTEFPGVLSDLIGDLTWSPDPVEIKLFSTDTEVLKRTAARVASVIGKIPGVVDVNDGLVVAGPSRSFFVHAADAARLGCTVRGIGETLRTALLGKRRTYLLKGDRTVGIRVLADPRAVAGCDRLETLPLRGPGEPFPLTEVAGIRTRPGILEMHRENLRQLVAVSARFTGMGLGHGIEKIRKTLREKVNLPPGMHVEFGGLYEQQRESFKNLALVLAGALLLVYAVLLLEFRHFLEPWAILFGAVLALTGTVAALWVTGITLNIVSFLGAIIGVGIVAKNGILLLDFTVRLRREGRTVEEALVLSGRRRLRPVLMTVLAAFLGLLPLAWGIGAGADMLRPLAVAVMGALVMSLLLSLVATPMTYALMVRLFRVDPDGPEPEAAEENR